MFKKTKVLTTVILLIAVLFAGSGCIGFFMQIPFYGWLFAYCVGLLIGATMVEAFFTRYE